MIYTSSLLLRVHQRAVQANRPSPLHEFSAVCCFTAAIATLSRGHVTCSYVPNLHNDVMITCYLLSIWSSFSLIIIIIIFISLELHRDPNLISLLTSLCPLKCNKRLNCSEVLICQVLHDCWWLRVVLWLIKRSWETLRGRTLMCQTFPWWKVLKSCIRDECPARTHTHTFS